MNRNIKINWLEVVDSTNLEAARCMAESDNMTIWFAEFQTAGRGQRENKWESRKSENLTFSILFKPDNLLASRQFIVSQAVSLGVVDYLKIKGIDAKIKWPNDIYVGDRKICGMLIENSIASANLTASIVGIGLNLNQREFDTNLPNPTSVILEKMKQEDECALNLSLRLELKLLLESILFNYLVSEREPEFIEEKYHSFLYRLGQESKFLEDGVEIRAKVKGVNKNNACLILELGTGECKEYSFKEIQYII